MKFAITVFLLVSSSAFAQNIAQLHQCYGELGDAAVLNRQALGPKGNQVYVSQKSVSDNSFLIFNNHNVYRCAYPKEGFVKNIINSCHENQKSQHKYNVNLKAGASTYTGVIEVSKAKPAHINTSLNWVYQTAIADNKSICNVTCSEELGEDTTSLIKSEIAEHIARAKKVWSDERDLARHQGMSQCNDMVPTLKREIANRFFKQTTTVGCWNSAQAEADKVADEKRKKMIAALNSCGGELHDLAAIEIGKLEGRPSSLTADGDSDNGDADPAFGNK